ncbi:peptidase propeptide and YPEB domain protein [Hydrogenophaga sp. RAC07]|uniref:PepSY domain-containing protein n=1 Tax=Hydrogenophaga sp. RAC07 TaxID=1842537 RepID=UPI00083D43D4|nr:PepSY domain-containing protein [Hydrogenophaga sp. RAC07]AOF88059.1 peptidase propeptide and YPEB domain protein [Hydrogenophaga sp. RAC07]
MNTFARLLCATVLVVSNLAWADLTRDDAAAVAQRASGGRVLSVEKLESLGQPVWRIKVVTPAGEVRVIQVDVVTGQTR